MRMKIITIFHIYTGRLDQYIRDAVINEGSVYCIIKS